MKATRNSIEQQADRSILADVSGRQADGAGGEGDHARVSGGTETARRFKATSSFGGTLPADSRWMCPATRAEAPRTRKRILRTASSEIPAAAATSASDKPSERIQSASLMSGFPLVAAPAPAVLTTDRLAEALAIMVSEIMTVLPIGGRGAALERVTNRLDDLGRTPGGNAAAGLLGAVGAALMRLEG